MPKFRQSRGGWTNPASPSRVQPKTILLLCMVSFCLEAGLRPRLKAVGSGADRICLLKSSAVMSKVTIGNTTIAPEDIVSIAAHNAPVELDLAIIEKVRTASCTTTCNFRT